jgi:hypothetical protein
VTPDRREATIWGCNVHQRIDSASTPTSVPIAWKAAYTQPVPIQVREHYLHRTLALLDWEMLGRSASSSQKKAASNLGRFTLRWLP